MGPPGHPGPKGEVGPPGPSLPGRPVSLWFEKVFMTLFLVGITVKGFSLCSESNAVRTSNFQMWFQTWNIYYSVIISTLKYIVLLAEDLQVILVTVLLTRKAYVNLP